jgi:hypothetical protein
MNVFSIRLAPARPQRLAVPLGNTRYTITLRWNRPLGVWIIDIADQAGNPLANGIAAVSGADLVNQLNYLGFDGALLAQSGADLSAPPSYDGLGVTDGIFYIPYGQAGQTPYARPVG